MYALVTCLLLGAIFDSCLQGKATAEDVPPNASTPPNCGVSPLTPGSTNTPSNGDVPWHAILYRSNNGEWQEVCGGTLISPRVILTAATCVVGKPDGVKPPPLLGKDVGVALGKIRSGWNVTEETEARPKVAEIKVHPDYYGYLTNYGSNIALVMLESDVLPTKHILPACLDLTANQIKQITEDTSVKGYVAGIGGLEECSPGTLCELRENLKYVETPILTFAECLKKQSSYKNLKFSRLTPDNVCGGNGTVSPTQLGDAGGGLTVVINGRHHVIGVANTKVKLELPDKPILSIAAFTNSGNYLDWIAEQLG